MYLILASIALIWIFIIFLDTIFKSCMLHPYINALYLAGLEIKPFSIYWTISRYNRYINRMGLYRRWFLKTWFIVGAIVTIAIFLPCMYLYASKLNSLYTQSSESESSNVVLVIPGYNLPLTYWKLYVCVLIICSVIHEFGHALAASRLGISVDSFGFAFHLIAPIAFVNLRLDRLRHSRWEQLYVYCAGIWHNIVLSLSCLFVLNFFGLLVSPLYHVGGGVQVLHVNELSRLSNPVSGLAPGEEIYALSNCAVKDLNSWYRCLQDIKEKPRGLCIPRDLLYKRLELDERIMAGEIVRLEDIYAAAPLEVCIDRTDHLFFYVEMEKYKVGRCVHLRPGIQKYKTCTISSECGQRSLCALPHLLKSQRFIIIYRDEKKPILAVEFVPYLIMDVKVTEFLPRWNFLSPDIPETIKEFLQYVFIFSNGLVCLNVLPFSSFDGTFILENIVFILPCSLLSYELRKILIKVIKMITLLVVGSIIVLSLFNIYK